MLLYMHTKLFHLHTKGNEAHTKTVNAVFMHSLHASSADAYMHAYKYMYDLCEHVHI